MTRLLCLLLLLAAACAAAPAPAEAFSSFKGRFGGQAGNCVYPDRNGNDIVLQNGSSMPADPYNPALNAFNRSCSCPADSHETRLREPATLACSDGLLVTAMAAGCECVRRPGTGSVTQCRVCVHDRAGGTGCSGWTPGGGGASSWSRWIYHEGGRASTQRKRFRMECR